MVRQHSALICTLLCTTALLGLIQPAGAAVQYTITDLGISSGAANHINEAGQVAGYTKAANGSYQAFLWSAGHLTMLPILLGNAYGGFLNDQGQVVGNAAAGSGNTDRRAVLWQNETIQDLNTAGGPNLLAAIGINNAGQIAVGTGTSAYIWENGVLRGLGLGSPSAINNAGQVAGTRDTGEVYSYTKVFHAVLWDNGSVRDLGTLGGKWSAAWGMNDAGLVVGAASPSGPVTSTSPNTACYWDAVGTHPIPTGEGSQAYGVNNSGEIVGIYGAPGQMYSHAFIYRDGIVMDLNDLIDPSSGWLLMRGWDINDRGQIIGEGTFQGQYGHFLLTPVPEPATLSLLALGGLLLARRRRA